MPTAPRLIIFDADGTLRRSTVPGKPCPDSRDQWELLPRVKETLSAIRWDADGCSLGIASNQGGVSLGHLSREAARQLLVDLVVAAVGHLPARTYIDLCTCPIGAGCACRKPAPGMLLRILADSGVSSGRALFVGDGAEDLAAARRAGIAFRWARDFFGWTELP
jgi:D-glycero-D-manno-heptose 1,7-bisphosphate phosphatase